MKELEILKPGQRLRKIRKMLGLRQEDIAGKNMSKNYISMFENGRRRINIINATYLADVLNDKAREKGIELNITASYFVKSEKDMVKDYCMDMLAELTQKEGISKEKTYKNLYQTIYLSKKYGLISILANSLKTKGDYLYRDGYYRCAIMHYSKSLIYFSKEEDKLGINNCYMAIGKSYFMDKNYEMAIAYFNLANPGNKDDDILYYKALSYYKLGNYEMAASIMDKIIFKDERVLKLEDRIYSIS